MNHEKTEERVSVEADEFQDTIVRSVESQMYPYVVNLKGVPYVMFPGTLNPIYAKAAMLLIDNLGVRDGDVVLDPFTGCGADAVFSVMGGASKAVAIDKYTMPFLCTRYNVHMLGLDEKISVRQGDVYDALEPDETFDLVVANPPFRDMKIVSHIHVAQRDPGYLTLRKFFGGARERLNPNGRIRMVFSNIGDTELMLGLATDAGFSAETVTGTKYGNDVTMEVYEMRMR